MCNNQYMKSVLEVQNPNPQSLVATTGLVQFTEKSVDTGASIEYESSTSVLLKRSGIYLIMVTADIATGTTAGDIITSLNKNGLSVKKVTTKATTTATTENIIIPKIVVVPKSCNCVDNTTKISVTNTGLAAVYNSVDLIVIKLA